MRLSPPALAVTLALLGASCSPAPAPASPSQPADQPPAPTSDSATEPTAKPEPPAPHPLLGLWQIRMERQHWWPKMVDGSLIVVEDGDGLRGSLTFDQMWGIDPKPVEFERTDPDDLAFTLHFAGDNTLPVVGTLAGGLLSLRAEWTGGAQIDHSVIHGERIEHVRRFEPHSPTAPFAHVADPAEVGIETAALDRMLWYAQNRDSDALVVVKDGRLVCHRTFLRPESVCTTQSITKVVASMAIPFLIEEGKLGRDLDAPMSTWFPEWADDSRRSRITLRHVLTHTTGLASSGTKAMQETSDYLEYARASKTKHEPGTRFAYSNQAIELLTGVVAQVAGEQVDKYVQQRIAEPLGITSWTWSRDNAGNAPAYVGLNSTAIDLARFGEMVANRGRSGDVQVVPEWWFDAIVEPSSVNDEVGLVWWLSRDPAEESIVQTQQRVDLLAASGYPHADRLDALVGRTFETRAAWWTAARARLGDEAVKSLGRYVRYPAVAAEVRGPVSCIYHTGSIGQYLVILPEQGLVVVRQRRGFAEDELERRSVRTDFHDVIDLARTLVR